MNHTEQDTLGTHEASKNNGPGPDARHGPGPEIMSASTVAGNPVFNNSEEELGDIKEIMVDMRTGKVGYAVMSFGSFLGMGGKLFAVPWNALQLDTARKCFILNVEKDRLKSAPGFDKDHWPNMADQSWAQDIHSYYGTKPYSDEQKRLV